MMGLIMSDFENTLRYMLNCLQQTTSRLSAKYSQDACPCFEKAAQIREAFARSQSGETIETLIGEMEQLRDEIDQFLENRLSVFEQEIFSYGEGPATATLRNARQRLVCVREALDQSSQAIIAQMKALALLHKANRLPLDGKFFA